MSRRPTLSPGQPLEGQPRALAAHLGRLSASPADDGDLAAYDTWLNAQLDHIDALLPTCAKLGIHVLIDLHTPPGGRDDASVCRLFQERKYQDHFLAVWDRIARRYVGNATIWGLRPRQRAGRGRVPDGLRDWHARFRDRTPRGAIDRDHAIIVEPSPWGSLAGLDHLEPLDVPGVIYSDHMYEPHPFTHQGVHNQATGVTYPGTIAGREWNEEQIRRTFGPAIRYQKDYHVPIYIGRVHRDPLGSRCLGVPSRCDRGHGREPVGLGLPRLS